MVQRAGVRVVWGTWNGIIERDGEALRRVGIMLRFFGTRGFLQSAGWVPHTSDVLTMEAGVFASKFPLLDEVGKESGDVVYALVNRKPNVSTHKHLKPSVAGAGALKWFDCYRGEELTITTGGKLRFTLELDGFGCILGTTNHTAAGAAAAVDRAALAERLRANAVAPPPPADLGGLLATMGALTARNLSSFSPDFVYPNFTLVDWDAKTETRPLHDAKPGEVYVPGSDFNFEASGVESEGGKFSGVDVQYPWE